jgi:hypothetical protein
MMRILKRMVEKGGSMLPAKMLEIRLMIQMNRRWIPIWGGTEQVVREEKGDFHSNTRDDKTDEWDKKIRTSCQRDGTSDLVMGGGMLIWLRGQGPFSKQTVVERKEIILSVGDGTEE